VGLLGARRLSIEKGKHSGGISFGVDLMMYSEGQG